ncbi:glycoside hydrolase family 65 protein [Salinicola sp. V024]|uniref:glycoside hydrolase family 65 protein n=1 Tax=Salinicola sp. V024 TaxID=3459609 RepID=UPI00404411CC
MMAWTLDYTQFEPQRERLREALCALGNGYFVTRGAAEEAQAGDHHYPGTYLAGGYNRVTTRIAGQEVENEDLVNLPNWLCLTFCVDEGEWFSPLTVEWLDWRQSLDLQDGVLRRELRFRDRQGRETTLLARRLVHMGKPHLAAIEWQLRADNWSGRIRVCSALDGRVSNDGVARYRTLASHHLVMPVTEALEADTIRLGVETSQSGLRVVEAARTRVFVGATPLEVERKTIREERYIADELTLELTSGQTVTVEKVVALFSSRDRAIADPALAAHDALEGAGRFAELLTTHVQAWAWLWRRCDVRLEDGHRTQMILRLHIFHLLQTVSPHSVELDVGVPARGLHGEAYRGHVFWDELFIFPFLNFRIPEITRALLRYRYRRLDEARRMAAVAGYRGAMYPWQSGSSGREESQKLHLNPNSGRWIADNSALQRHVSSAVAYNVWRYYEVTGDREFLAYYGAEMLLEIARFWASAAHWNPQRERYDITGVMGPDEFHDRYPDAASPGLDNNTYTNMMAAWVLKRAIEVRDVIGAERRQELGEALSLTEREIAQWEEISSRLFVAFHADGIPSQFEGYEQLKEFDWEGYRHRYGDIQRLDRLLEAEGDSVNRYKASKQADVLMLFYLFSTEELGELFAQLGYPFAGELLPRTIAYYQQRTSDGSTLSRVVSSWVLARLDRPRSLALLKDALESDITDVQGGTTAEGIHLGAMAGTVDLVQRGQTGLEIRGGCLRLNPSLPRRLRGLHLRLRFRGHWLELAISSSGMTLEAAEGWEGPGQVMAGNQVHDFMAGQCLTFHYRGPDRGWHLGTPPVPDNSDNVDHPDPAA